MNRVPHIVWALLALVIVISSYIVLRGVWGYAVPKLMDGVLLLIGTIAGLARGDVPPGTDD